MKSPRQHAGGGTIGAWALPIFGERAGGERSVRTMAAVAQVRGAGADQVVEAEAADVGADIHGAPTERGRGTGLMAGHESLHCGFQQLMMVFFRPRPRASSGQGVCR